jgi:glutamate-1-semialdehyde 2,1-aminomutase
LSWLVDNAYNISEDAGTHMETSSENLLETFFQRSQKSKALYERAMRVIPGGSNRGVVFYKPYPLYSSRAKGSHIWDVDGFERIDYCFNYSSLILGHANPAVMDAIARELENGLGRGTPTPVEVELAEKVSQLVSSAELVKFTVTGTEAVMNAIRAARAYSGKDDIVVFEGAYHGSSDAASVSGLAFQSSGIPSDVRKHTIVVPFNDPNSLEKVLREKRGQIAAVLMEPFLGSGGTIAPREEFTRFVREATEKTDVLLILDEIVTGFRAGKGGWQEKYRIKPDFTVLGKNVTGGMPGAAVCGKKEMMEDAFGFPPSQSLEPSHPKTPLSGTFNAFPLSMAAGLATLNQLTARLYENLDRTAEAICHGFVKLASDLGMQVRAPRVSSIFQFYFTSKDIVDRRSVNGANTEMRRHLDIALLNEGVYLSPGHFCTTALATTASDVKHTLSSIESALRKIPCLQNKCNR